MAAILYPGCDCTTATTVTLFRVRADSTMSDCWSPASNCGHYATVSIRYPKFFVGGRGFYDEKEARIYRNEIHSRSCWRCPERIDPHVKERKVVCPIRRARLSRKQVQHNKRRQYVQRLRVRS